jgi:hypothetical protein
MNAMNELALAQQTTLAVVAQQQVNLMKRTVAQLTANNKRQAADIVTLQGDKQQLSIEV